MHVELFASISVYWNLEVYKMYRTGEFSVDAIIQNDLYTTFITSTSAVHYTGDCIRVE